MPLISPRNSSPWQSWPALLLLLATAACAPLQPVSPEVNDCRELFRQIDTSTAELGCRNAALHQPHKLPAVRTSRFWSALGNRPHDLEGEAFYWRQLQEHDRATREEELRCLAAQPATNIDLAQTMAQLDSCRPLLVAALTPAAEERQATLAVPDDYSLTMRTFGLYPLVSLPFAVAVKNAYDERREWFRRPLADFTANGVWRSVGPETTQAPLSREDVAAVLARTADNPLHVPLPSELDARRLAETFAPIVVQQEADASDRWGRVSWRAGTVTIAGDAPVVYHFYDHLLFQGEPRLRLNYVFWYQERGGDSTPWIEAGNLDGITYGVVLDRNGDVLTAQLMNNCGCYHSFFPGPRLGAQRPVTFFPDPLVLQPFPVLAPGERPGLFLTSGWHQIVRLAPQAQAPESYALHPYRELEALPAAGEPQPLFNQDGIIEASARFERFLFFSMGIPSVGSMRQRGHQPITLLGREHYDDPDLLHRNFFPR